MKIIDKLGLIYIKDNKLLVARSKGKDAYYLPGGKREEGETDFQALSREIKEEMSVDLVLNSLKLVNTFEAQAHGKEKGIIVKITAYAGEFKGELKPDSEIEEIGWFNYKDKVNATPAMKLILDYLKNINLID